MVTTTEPGAAGASVPAPSAGEALRFAAYVADLIGNDRITAITWRVEDQTTAALYVTVTDTTHGQTVAHLLGLARRSDVARDQSEGFSAWKGTSGNVPVFLSAPLALGGLPQRRPWDWSETTTANDVTAADVREVA